MQYFSMELLSVTERKESQLAYSTEGPISVTVIPSLERVVYSGHILTGTIKGWL